MTVDQVITLLQNGYTKEEITQMEQSPGESQPAAEQQPAEQQPTEPQPAQPAQEATQNPVPNEVDKRLTSIEQNIANLIKSIQQSNLRNDSFGKTPDSLEEQTDKIMASLIRPEHAKKKGVIENDE